ncbi:MAG TPA: V-type ATPase 116kDa subunit family protein, partial [Thermoanaerobaculia bacterium]|nr:V-type ATPase 116kDa subunit family protein [Thermoanaerobaculia bacterium]
MAKVRIMGPKAELSAVLDALQQLAILHLALPRQREGLSIEPSSPRSERRRRQLSAALQRADLAMKALEVPARPLSSEGAAVVESEGTTALCRAVRTAYRVSRKARGLVERIGSLEEEGQLLRKYRDLFDVFGDVLASQQRWVNAAGFEVIIRATDDDHLKRLRAALQAEIGDSFELKWKRLPSGDIALLILVPESLRSRIEQWMKSTDLEEIALPEGYEERGLAEAIPAMSERLREVEAQLLSLAEERRRLASSEGPRLRQARASLSQRIERLDALAASGRTEHAFVIDGWVPSEWVQRLKSHLKLRTSSSVTVAELGRESWKSENAPVVLSNPRIFRPFEAIVRLLPLPRYGSIDPTPFVAVFFPMFFGLILGDLGYGAMLALLALLLWRGSERESLRRSIAEMIGACSLFTLIFGALYGELFGDLGHRWVGLRPLWFDRSEAVLPFLGLALALGLVHILLGLSLGVVTAFQRSRKEALGKGVAILMVTLIVVALLAMFEILPRAFFVPAVVILLIAFPVLVVTEGLLAPIELLATVGNVLSYARVMALGTASVMLAVVANRMVGSLGSVAVGALFALLFHLVNFALGLFSPTIHALRLHYVEFFGKFY